MRRMTYQTEPHGCQPQLLSLGKPVQHPRTQATRVFDKATPVPANTSAVEENTAFTMKVAERRAEREQAFHLVHTIYNRSGLTADNPSQMRVMRHHLDNQTDVLLGKLNREVVFTVTLVGDGAYGLPMESLFADEINAMRAEGLRLAEVSCLAQDQSGDPSGRFETFVRMVSLLFQTARRREIDRLLLAVHPRHAKLYQRLFGCERCSDIKQYDAVQGNPAVLCSHDFAAMDVKRFPLYDQIYRTKFAPWQLDGAHMSAEEKAYFEQFVTHDSHKVISMAA